jgi:hypothetical protein
MNSKLWIRKAATMALSVAIIATYSMVALAGDGRTAGEIILTGNTSSTAVTVNGESAKSGRTIFSSSTISTPEDAGAIINLGKAGKLELAPKTTFSVTFDEQTAAGDLTAGSVSVLSASEAVSVKNLAGEVVKVNVGETASATSSSSAPRAGGSGGHSIWPFVLVLGGAVGLIALAVSQDNDVELGGGAVVVSPTR